MTTERAGGRARETQRDSVIIERFTHTVVWETIMIMMIMMMDAK